MSRHRDRPCSPSTIARSMKLKTLNVAAPFGFDRAREFNLSSHCVTVLYLWCLGALETRSVSKVLVTGVLEAEEEREREALAVLQTWRRFDFPAYWASSEKERKRMILDFVHYEMLRLAAQRGWDAGALTAAYKCALDKNLRNIQLWPVRPVASPGKRVKAQVEFEFGTEDIEGSAIFTDKQGNELARQPLFQLPAGDFYLADALGKLTWEDDRTVVLTSRLKNQEWRTRLP
jgi:hypothetical protein